MIELTLYSRPGCHLCDDMKAVVMRVASTLAIRLTETDISGDPELEQRYGLQIPVLTFRGKTIAKARVAEEGLRRILAERAGAAG